ncbi:hypothetical protein T8K17_11470 [Thalassobaculum sp. OXR-137]|uniref:hypothetical protein n=1 Tax=Thalassobaculum sp. OXR-137 TaxID=3100173 RepID=UPI002AC8ADD3|nr:hypothetical protein [Thalassobaculum sp. OXR-137]WPZ36754.1 hypothetical protein T8K17_11470 [Thalassobaculum sp. OXR-137]
MAAYRFKLEYFDPTDEQYKEVERVFEDTETISAKFCAEDAAYTMADKHWHRVTDLGEVVHQAGR